MEFKDNQIILSPWDLQIKEVQGREAKFPIVELKPGLAFDENIIEKMREIGVKDKYIEVDKDEQQMEDEEPNL